MPKFTVEIEGRNFLGRHASGQKDEKYGFITIVLAQAQSHSQAEMKAIEMLKLDNDLKNFPKTRKMILLLSESAKLPVLRSGLPSLIQEGGLFGFLNKHNASPRSSGYPAARRILVAPCGPRKRADLNQAMRADQLDWAHSFY